nr:RecName: Full=14.5 kDa structural polyprotein [Shrimp white spot syndrome virus]
VARGGKTKGRRG